MKRYPKTALLLMAAMVLCISGCRGRHSDRLSVYSTDYNMIELRQQELSGEDYAYSGETEISPYQCYVSISNEYGGLPGKLVVNNSRPSHVQTCFGNNGYFIGVDYTEFAAGVIYCPYTGTEAVNAMTVLHDRCVAFFEGDGTYCYAVVSWNCSEDNENTALYKLGFPSEGSGSQPTVEKVCDITSEYAYVAVQSGDGVIYVGTSDGLYAVTASGTVTELKVPAAWCDLGINSMVEMDGRLYFGTLYGILEYVIEENAYRWFPVSYDDVILKSK